MAAFTAAQALEMALQIERNGEAYYNAALTRQNAPEIRALFSDLAAQERVHYQVFERMLGQMGPAPALPAEEYDQYDAYVLAALNNALFAGPDKALRLAEEAVDAEAAIRGALGFEKDTLLFFYDLREMVAEKDREAVSRIIAEEKSHVRRLARRL
ncbi:MAG: ferritin family protein [Anaerolineales bacterium]|nr:ferritin family protein [Anaerolineales bacterium]